MSSSVSRGALAAALAVAAFPAAAQSRNPEIVVTAERAEAEVRERPGGVAIVTQDEYDDRVAVSLRDALAMSPGVYTQPRFGQEVRISIRGSGLSRGFHMRGLTLLQDGIPINLADDNGDFQELDPQVFDRIEVYRGANALRHGGSTLGGAINAVAPTGRTAPGGLLRIDGGSFATVRGKAAAGFASGPVDAWLALTGDRSDGDRDHADRYSLRFNGNAGMRLTDRVETRFYAAVNHIRQHLPGSLTLAQALSTPELSLPNNIAGDQARDIDSLRLQNRTTIALGGGSVSFGGYLNAKELYHPIFQLIDQVSTDRGAFASLDFEGRVAGMPVEASLGGQARFGRVAAKQFVNLAGKRGALTSDVRQRAHTLNGWAELRATPVPGLTLIAGGIYSDGGREVTNRLVPANSARRGYDGFAPKFGLLWEPGGDVQVYANYSRSLEFPGFGELVQAPLQGFVPLDSQRAWTAEIGTRGRAGMIGWDISLYRADISGEMLQFTVSPGVPATTFNAGRTRHQGVEAALDLAPADWLHLRQTWLYSDFAFRGDAQYGDNRLPVVPEHLYRAELRLGGAGHWLAPRVEWVPRGAWADYRNTVRAPGYAMLGLGGEAAIGGHFTLFVDARNLTGEKAVGDISAVVLANSATVAFYPIERRAFYAGVRAGF